MNRRAFLAALPAAMPTFTHRSYSVGFTVSHSNLVGDPLSAMPLQDAINEIARLMREHEEASAASLFADGFA